MTRIETTIAIIILAISFIILFINRDELLMFNWMIFNIGYLTHFIVSKFESNSLIETIHNEAHFTQTLTSIPLIETTDDRYSFDEFLEKCDAELYQEFHQSCFKNDCFTLENQAKHYDANRSYFIQVLLNNLKLNK